MAPAPITAVPPHQPPTEDSVEADLARLHTLEGEAHHALTVRIVERLLPLARSTARRYSGRGEPLDDLVQVATLGLLLAVQRYRPGGGMSFAAYAVPTMTGELRRYFRDHAWTVRPPRRVQELRAQVSRTHEALQADLGRPPSRDELAAALGVAGTDIDEALLASESFRPASLDLLRESGAGQLDDQLGAEDAGLTDVEDRLTVIPLLHTLTDRERLILRLRFVEGWTQKEIAAEIGVTQMQVSRLLAGILARLHRASGTAAGSADQQPQGRPGRRPRC